MYMARRKPNYGRGETIGVGKCGPDKFSVCLFEPGSQLGGGKKNDRWFKLSSAGHVTVGKKTGRHGGSPGNTYGSKVTFKDWKAGAQNHNRGEEVVQDEENPARTHN